MSELNPNHGVTRELHGQWHKLCAFTMMKLGIDTVEITTTDMDQFAASGRCNIAVYPKDGTITLMLLSDAQAREIARKAGGMPV